MSGDIDFTNAGLTSLDFAAFDAAPTGSVSARRMQWNPDRATLRLGGDASVNLDIGQQLMLYAKSVETNTLAKGEVVFVFGAQGDNPTIKRASHTSEALSARTIGIMAESVTSNNNGFVVTRGTVYNVNTTNFTEGSTLYLGANGTLQTNLPTAPLHGTFIGVVERVGAANGQIYVAVQNYQELRELSDVFVNGATDGQVLTYIAASNRWEARTGTGAGTITNLVSGSTRLIITNGAGPQVSFGLDVSGLATGTPVYAETDSRWTSVSNSIRTDINKASATGIAAYAAALAAAQTNQPIHWVNSNNQYHGLIISPYWDSSPTYLSISNVAYGDIVYLDLFQAADGQALTYSTNNKTWRYGVIQYAEVAGNADNLNGLAASAYLTVSSFQSTSTNYARFITTTVAPTGSTATGLNGELRVDTTNLYIYIGRSNKWMRVPGTFSWP